MVQNAPMRYEPETRLTLTLGDRRSAAHKET
jgi:hypothetical protein